MFIITRKINRKKIRLLLRVFLNNRASHSRYFSDELDAQIFL